jgi:hypothetical protein
VYNTTTDQFFFTGSYGGGSTFTAAGISGSWQGEGFISSSGEIASDISGAIDAATGSLSASLSANTFKTTGQRDGDSGITGSLTLQHETSPTLAIKNINTNYALRLQQDPTNAIISFVDNTNHNLVFTSANDTYHLFLDSGNGFTGIGTDTPTEKLQVEGNISSSGAINTLSHITASGDISASGLLSISSSQNSGQTYGVLVKDPNTGRVYHTGSYGTGDTVDLHFSASEGTGFSFANGATASFESGSAGITVTAGATNKITIGASTDNVTFNQITGSDLIITNTASISYLETIYETASVIYSSGSTKFGNSMDDDHWFTGSMLITASEFIWDKPLGSALTVPLVYDVSTGKIFTGSEYVEGASGMTQFHISASEGAGFSLTNLSTASFTSGSGGGLTVTAGPTNNIEFELVGVLSSSYQIASDISGAIDAATGSVLLNYGLLSSSYQIASDISGAIDAATGSLSASLSANTFKSTGQRSGNSGITGSLELSGTGHLTASGNISASGLLYASVTSNSDTGLKTVMYSTSTGRFFSTGSYGGGGGGATPSLQQVTTVGNTTATGIYALASGVTGDWGGISPTPIATSGFFKDASDKAKTYVTPQPYKNKYVITGIPMNPVANHGIVSLLAFPNNYIVYGENGILVNTNNGGHGGDPTDDSLGDGKSVLQYKGGHLEIVPSGSDDFTAHRGIQISTNNIAFFNNDASSSLSGSFFISSASAQIKFDTGSSAIRFLAGSTTEELKEVLFISRSGVNPRIGIGTNNPIRAFDFKEIRDDSRGGEILIRGSRTNKGADDGDEVGRINFAIDSSSYDKVDISGSAAEIVALVDSVDTSGVQGSLSLRVAASKTAEPIQRIKIVGSVANANLEFTGSAAFDTDVTIGDDLTVSDFALLNAVRIGSTATDPGDGRLYVEDYGTFVGGLKVGSSEDPGANNLKVAGNTITNTFTTTGNVQLSGSYINLPTLTTQATVETDNTVLILDDGIVKQAAQNAMPYVKIADGVIPTDSTLLMFTGSGGTKEVNMANGITYNSFVGWTFSGAGSVYSLFADNFAATSATITNITASGNISSSGDLTIQGFPSVSASLASATSGGGTITGVTAGDGLTGGGTSGTVTLNVDATIATLIQLNASSSALQSNIDGKQATLTFGIANTNVLRADANVVDNDFLRVNGTSIEGRSAAEVLSDIGGQNSIGDGDLTIAFTDGLQAALDAKQASLTFGKSSGNALKSEEALTTNDVLLAGSTNIKGRTYAELKSDLSLNNVTNESKATMFTSPTFTGNSTFANITSSGNISSSGTITAEDIVVGNDITVAQGGILEMNKGRIYSSLVSNNFFIDGADSGTIIFNDQELDVDVQIRGSSGNYYFKADADAEKVGIGGNFSAVPGEALTVHGNISSSGDLYGDNVFINNVQVIENSSTEYQFGPQTGIGNTVKLQGDSITLFGGAVTASGNISSSGYVMADTYHANLGNSKGYGIGAISAKPILSIQAEGYPLSLGAPHGSYVAAGVNIYTTGSDATKGLFLDSVGNITASGNISSSGDLSIQGFPSVSASLAAASGGGGATTYRTVIESSCYLGQSTKIYLPFNSLSEQTSFNYLSITPAAADGKLISITLWPQSSGGSTVAGLHLNSNATAATTVTETISTGTPLTFTFSSGNTFSQNDELSFSLTSTSNINGLAAQIVLEYDL